jgi:branched-chain amino acid transport system permease protein
MNTQSPGSIKRVALSSVALWGVIVVALSVPLLFGTDYHLRFLAEILIIGIAVMSLDLLIGFGGLVSLGHAALFGSAAYAVALTAHHVGADLVLVLVVGVVTGMILAVLIGAVVVRTENLFFLILTLVTAQMIWELIFRSREITGGADGLRGIPTLQLHLGFSTLPLAGSASLYIIAAILAIVCFLVARSFIWAPIGRALVGTREQPLRMVALGYSIPQVRLIALIVSGGLAGAAGALYPFVNLYIGPSAVHWTTSAMMVIALVIGGVGSLYGAFIGSAIYLAFQTYVSSYTDRWQLVVGAVFVLTVIVMPHGIAHALQNARRRAADEKGGTQS